MTPALDGLGYDLDRWIDLGRIGNNVRYQQRPLHHQSREHGFLQIAGPARIVPRDFALLIEGLHHAGWDWSHVANSNN